jgi:hypothetical protein
MGLTGVFYLGIRPVTEPAGRDDPGESFVRIVKTLLGLEVPPREEPLGSAPTAYELAPADRRRIAASFSVYQEHHVDLVTLDELIAEDVGDRVLMDLFMGLSIAWRSSVGRTFLDASVDGLDPEEWTGPLRAVGWFQYFGPERARAWPPDTWKSDLFHRVAIQPDGSVGLCLGPSPFKYFPRREAAKHLGIALRPL